MRMMYHLVSNTGILGKGNPTVCLLLLNGLFRLPSLLYFHTHVYKHKIAFYAPNCNRSENYVKVMVISFLFI